MRSTDGQGGIVTLSVDGEAVGQIELADRSGIAVRGGADVGADQYSPVTGSYEAPFEFGGTIHVLEVKIVPRGELPRAPTPEEASEAG